MHAPAFRRSSTLADKSFARYVCTRENIISGSASSRKSSTTAAYTDQYLLEEESL